MLVDTQWSSSLIRTLLLCAFLAAALFFALFHINRSLWQDEAYSVQVAGRSFEGIISELRHDTHPPLYYMLLSAWMRLFGLSELSVRSLSGIFYMACIAVVYLLGASVYDRKTGLLCAFLYMLSPLSTSSAQFVRMYSLLGFLSALSVLFFVRLFLLGRDSKVDAAVYVVVNILASFTHIWFFFLLFSQGLVCLLLFRRKLLRFAALLALSLLPYALLWTPILLLQMRGDATDWIGKPGVKEFATGLLGFFGFKVALCAYPLFLFLILFRWQGGHIRRQDSDAIKSFLTEKRNLTFFIILFVTLLVPFLLSQVKPIFGPTRYAIIALPSFAVWVGALLSRFADRQLLLAACAVLLAGVTWAFVKYQTRPGVCTDKSMTQYLAAHARAQDVIVYTSLSRTATNYYLRLMRPDSQFVEMTFPAELDEHSGYRNLQAQLRRKSSLEQEADQLTDRIVALMQGQSGRRVWLLYGVDTEVSDLLKTRLDARLVSEGQAGPSCEDTGEEATPFYRKFLIYEGAGGGRDRSAPRAQDNEPVGLEAQGNGPLPSR